MWTLLYDGLTHLWGMLVDVVKRISYLYRCAVMRWGVEGHSNSSILELESLGLSGSLRVC